MKKLIRLSLLALAFLAVKIEAVEAQKFGYLSSQAILAEMPEVQLMNANLQTLGTQLQKKGQGMLAAYKEKEANAMRKKERGEMSPLEEQTVLEELQKEQESIIQFEQNMQKDLSEKEQELLKPIYDKVNTAIKQVAQEGGYEMIFEAGVLLWAEESTDVSALVKAKLGL
ncbi:MAG: OmpH family outer membrane protein [Bacteroidota bacterium]